MTPRCLLALSFSLCRLLRGSIWVLFPALSPVPNMGMENTSWEGLGLMFSQEDPAVLLLSHSNADLGQLHAFPEPPLWGDSPVASETPGYLGTLAAPPGGAVG